MFRLWRRHTSTTEVPRTPRASNPAPTQSTDFVRTKLDDIAEPAAQALISAIAATIQEKEAAGKDFTVTIAVPDNLNITPQTVAAYADEIARSNHCVGRFIGMIASRRKGTLSYVVPV